MCVIIAGAFFSLVTICSIIKGICSLIKKIYSKFKKETFIVSYYINGKQTGDKMTFICDCNHSRQQIIVAHDEGTALKKFYELASSEHINFYNGKIFIKGVDRCNVIR